MYSNEFFYFYSVLIFPEKIKLEEEEKNAIILVP
jgi:hypothetical protein